MSKNKTILYSLILAFSLIAPFAFPAFGTQLATLWLMIIVALTWDMTGGQMGYNSLGNIFFYGTGTDCGRQTSRNFPSPNTYNETGRGLSFLPVLFLC